MRNTLLLRADSVATETWRWLRLGPEGTPLGSIHAGSLQNAAEEAAGLRVSGNTVTVSRLAGDGAATYPTGGSIALTDGATAVSLAVTATPTNCP